MFLTLFAVLTGYYNCCLNWKPHHNHSDENKPLRGQTLLWTLRSCCLTENSVKGLGENVQTKHILGKYGESKLVVGKMRLWCESPLSGRSCFRQISSHLVVFPVITSFSFIDLMKPT